MAGVASEKENVVIAAGDCALTILPQLGGKISSIRLKGRELLQQPIGPMEPRTRTMAFDESDASGWDECLPSVAACTMPFADGEARIPDHGDLWRVEWARDCGIPRLGSGQASEPEDRDDAAAKSISLRARCFSLPLELERTVSLQERPGGWRLGLFYTLTNTGTHAAPWSWAAHPLFAVDPGDCINLPNSISSLRLEGSAARRLGQKGDEVNWPVARLANGNGEADLRFVPGPNSGVGEKLFAGPMAGDIGWCELLRPRARVAIRVSFQTEKTPYLGLWLCDGGWPDRPGLKQHCLAIEPATAPVDSLAETGSWSRTLAPGESCEWTMLVDLKTF